MVGKKLDVFGWTSSYAKSDYSGLPLKITFGAIKQTQIVFQAYLTSPDKVASDSKAAANAAVKAADAAAIAYSKAQAKAKEAKIIWDKYVKLEIKSKTKVDDEQKNA